MAGDAPLEPQRGAFDIPDEVAYLNTAYMGPLPHEAVEGSDFGELD